MFSQCSNYYNLKTDLQKLLINTETLTKNTMTTNLTKYSIMKPAIAIILSAFILASCGSGKDKKAELEKLKTKQTNLSEKIKTLEAEIALTDTTAKTLKVKDVVVSEVQPDVFRHFIEVQGIVDADQNVNVLPTMPGKVIRINVKEGDVVKTGQVLAEIDHDLYIKQLNSLQPQIDLAKDAFTRQQRLWDQKIGSEMQYLQAKAQKESLEKQTETIREQIDMHLIKSPINGTVDQVGIKVGQLASNMSMEPSFRVVNLGSLKVKGEIAEAYASKVKVGNNVMLHFPDLNKDVDAKISFTERVIDPLTRTFTTEARLAGDNADYHPNMIAILKIIDYENSSVISLPINVIQSSNNESFVYVAVVKGNRVEAKRQVITIGSTYNGQAEILSGLAANDKVVVTGQLDLADGMLIKF